MEAAGDSPADVNMGLTEILLILLGILAFAASFILPEKLSSQNLVDVKIQEEKIKELIETEVKQAAFQIEEKVEETISASAEKTERYMERMSNEKIMAIQEYSDTVLSQIPTPEALCESAMYHVSLLEKFDFNDIVISIKGSSVEQMVKANRLVAARCDYPIHIGVTEAGSEQYGMIKSAAGIGALLCDGIGDTMRVSLTADPVKEVSAARAILNALEIKGQCGMNIVSCPTCGRTKIDLISLEHQFREAAEREGLLDYPIRVALMGCVVNGPGEAREADMGVAGGKDGGALFVKGESPRAVKGDLAEALIAEIRKRVNG